MERFRTVNIQIPSIRSCPYFLPLKPLFILHNFLPLAKSCRAASSPAVCARRHVKISAANRLAMAACTPGTFAVKSLTSQPRYSAGNTENRCEKRRCLHARQHRLQPYLCVWLSACVHHCARTVLETAFNLASSPRNGVFFRFGISICHVFAICFEMALAYVLCGGRAQYQIESICCQMKCEIANFQ
jgi:hypothetical protein